MKIADVAVGTEYGALDSPSSRYSSIDPRQVKVLEIVTEEERVYGGHYLSGGSQRTRSVRRVKVEVLDGEKKKVSSWRRDKIENASKGDKIVVEARQLVGLWSELRDDIKQRKAEEQARIELEESICSRLKAAGFKDLSWGAVHVNVKTNGRVEVEFNDNYVEKLLKKLGV